MCKQVSVRSCMTSGNVDALLTKAHVILFFHSCTCVHVCLYVCVQYVRASSCSFPRACAHRLLAQVETHMITRSHTHINTPEHTRSHTKCNLLVLFVQRAKLCACMPNMCTCTHTYVRYTAQGSRERNTPSERARVPMHTREHMLNSIFHIGSLKYET